MTTCPRARPVEFEARDILDAMGYHSLRFNGAKSPVNLVGIDDQEVLLVQVRRERMPIPGIREVNARYRGDMDLLRGVGSPRCCKKELWVYFGQEGFHYYEVFPGGLMEIGQP